MMPLSPEWLTEQHAADQRRFLTIVAGSIVVHAALVGALAVAPMRPRSFMPDVLRVDLVALPAPAGPSAPARPKPAPAARPKPKQVVLPKEAPAAIPKAVPVPVSKPKPRPVKPAARPEPIEYEDALSQLRAELGEEAPPSRNEEAEAEAETDAVGVSPGGESDGAPEAEAKAWHRAVSRHLGSCWITPPEFLNRALATGLEVRLTVQGAVLGEPAVTHRSGDPFFDENAVRAVMRCAPLPAPPAPGSWRFAFTSETR